MKTFIKKSMTNSQFYYQIKLRDEKLNRSNKNK